MDGLERIKAWFLEKYSNTHTVEFFNEGSTLGVLIRMVSSSNSYVDVQITEKTAYIHMILVDKKGQGIGTQLMVALVDLLRYMGCTHLSGHVTDYAVVGIYEKIFSKDKLLFFERSLFGFGKQLSYDEALKIPEHTGFYLLVNL